MSENDPLDRGGWTRMCVPQDALSASLGCTEPWGPADLPLCPTSPVQGRKTERPMVFKNGLTDFFEKRDAKAVMLAEVSSRPVGLPGTHSAQTLTHHSKARAHNGDPKAESRKISWRPKSPSCLCSMVLCLQHTAGCVKCTCILIFK